MSFEKFKDTIEQGDTVILYMRPNNMHAIQVQPKIKNKRDEWVENVFQTTYGALKVQALIGKKYGSKVYLSKGWAYVLHPTPELWTLTLPHRTQIIYTPDISMIIFQLEIKPGSVVIECGVYYSYLMQINAYLFVCLKEQKVPKAFLRDSVSDHSYCIV